MATTDADKPILKSAPPPLHTTALVGIIFAIFIALFPSLESIDEAATTDTFTRVLFPHFLSPTFVAVIRLFIAAVFILDVFYGILYKELETECVYLPESKLKTTTIFFRGYLVKPRTPYDRVGLGSVTSFTEWSFLLLGVSFLLSGLAQVLAMLEQRGGSTTPAWLLRLALLTFECAAPTTLLVASVVRYAIWPMLLNSKKDTVVMKMPRTLMHHNGNVLAALVEIGLLGGLPVRLQDFSVAPLFGIVYIFFSWYMADKWTSPKEGIQYTYFFLDTTLGWKVSVSMLMLLLVLTMSFGLFSTMQQWFVESGNSIGVNVLAMVVVSSVVCRFRD